MKKTKTNFEPVNDSDVTNKAYVDEKFLRIDGHLLFLKNDYNEIELQYNKQSAEEILIQRTVKTTIQIFI